MTRTGKTQSNCCVSFTKTRVVIPASHIRLRRTMNQSERWENRCSVAPGIKERDDGERGRGRSDYFKNFRLRAEGRRFFEGGH